MPSPLFPILRLLEERRLHFSLVRNAKDSIAILVTMVGQRLEVYVNEDDDVTFSTFLGDESVLVGEEALIRKLESE